MKSVGALLTSLDGVRGRARERAFAGEMKLQSHISSLIGIHVARLAKAKISAAEEEFVCVRAGLFLHMHACVPKEGLSLRKKKKRHSLFWMFFSQAKKVFFSFFFQV